MPDKKLVSSLVAGLSLLFLVSFPSCALFGGGEGGSMDFYETLALLEANTEIALLYDAAGSGVVAVAPEFSARVMMSGFGDIGAPRLGWVNEPVVRGEELNPAFINHGGADRLWLSPEGGQFALFFGPYEDFDLDHWMTPTTFNSEPYEVIETEPERIVMSRAMSLMNYSETRFDLLIERSVSTFSRNAAAASFDLDLPEDVQYVGYTTENTLINKSTLKMTREGGLVSLWILGQFDASPSTYLIAPFKKGEGPVVKSDYFGEVPPERLVVDEERGVAVFLCDGRRRTKIGLGIGRCRDTLGSYDFDRNILTVVTFNLPKAGHYANNSWEIQDSPYAGDVVNSYNNGPEGRDGDVREKFYEIETLSPVKELSPGGKIVHSSTTLHFGGSFDDLNAICKKILGTDLTKVPLP